MSLAAALVAVVVLAACCTAVPAAVTRHACLERARIDAAALAGEIPYGPDRERAALDGFAERARAC